VLALIVYLRRGGFVFDDSAHVDAHLPAATAISGSLLWTGDKRLREIAAELGFAWLEADR
jgi:hypothetical protein